MSQTQTAPVAELSSLKLAPTAPDGSDRAFAGPLKPTGALDSYTFREETPVLGRTYTDLDIVKVIESDNADELIRELAIIISQRNVVFLRNQQGILTYDQLKTFANKLGTLTGRPAESALHIHPT